MKNNVVFCRDTPFQKLKIFHMVYPFQLIKDSILNFKKPHTMLLFDFGWSFEWIIHSYFTLCCDFYVLRNEICTQPIVSTFQ